MIMTAPLRRALVLLVTITAVPVGTVPVMAGDSRAAASPVAAHRVDALLVPVVATRANIRPAQARTLARDLGRCVDSASHHRLRLTTKTVDWAGTTTCAARTSAKALEQARFPGDPLQRYDMIMVITERRCRSISGSDATTPRRGSPDVITVYGVAAGFGTVDRAGMPLAHCRRP